MPGDIASLRRVPQDRSEIQTVEVGLTLDAENRTLEIAGHLPLDVAGFRPDIQVERHPVERPVCLDVHIRMQGVPGQCRNHPPYLR